MAKKLTNNIGLKLLSLALAVLLWLGVVNSTDATIVKTISNLPITVENEEVLTNIGKTYTVDTVGSVMVNVRQSQWNSVTASDFTLYVDMNEWYPDTGTLPIHMRINDSSIRENTVTLRTTVARITTDELDSLELPVEIDTRGTLADGYTVVSQAASPASVHVTGPARNLARLGRASVVVDVTDQVGAVSVDGAVQLYDKNGDAVVLSDQQLELSTDTVSVSMQILKSSTVPIVLGPVSGTAAEGYLYSEAVLSQATATVYGLKSALGNFTSLVVDTDRLSVEGASSDRVVVLDLTEFLPDGISLAADAERSLTVTLVIEKLESRTFSFEPEEITLEGREPGFLYEIADGSAGSVTLRGLAEDLEHVTVAGLHPVAAVGGLDAGTHRLEPQVTLEAGAYEITSYQPVTVLVAAEPESTESETDETAEGQTEPESTVPETEESDRGTEE